MPVDETPGSLLCVVPYESNVGFAWNFIEGLYARLADRLAERGIPTAVSYLRIDSPPRTLEGSAATPIVLDLRAGSIGAFWNVLRSIRRRRVKVVYFTDTPSVTPVHWLLRLAGVRWIVVHDHISGERTAPRGLRRAAKWVAARLPGLAADRVIAVSDYVARRQREVVMLPPARIQRLWNGLPLPPVGETREAARASLGLPGNGAIIVCACRAAPEKGVETLFRAFDRLWLARPKLTRPILVYVGDGPQMAGLLKCRDKLAAREDIRCVGYQSDVGTYLTAATAVAVPSLWQDALPLGVLEAMARARPVVASSVGGIPEMVRDGEEGYLVLPGDVQSLYSALGTVLDNPDRGAELGRAGRVRVEAEFRPEVQLDGIWEAVALGFAGSSPVL